MKEKESLLMINSEGKIVSSLKPKFINQTIIILNLIRLSFSFPILMTFTRNKIDINLT